MNKECVRTALLSLLNDFETANEERQWKSEKFSVYNSDCGWPEVELDFAFFWKVFDQYRLAGKSLKVFEKLRADCGIMANGIRQLASLPDSLLLSGLKHAYESGELERFSRPVASAFDLGRGGWRELAFAIDTARRLCQWFPDPNQEDYILMWISNTLKLSVLSRNEIVTALNEKIQLKKENYRDELKNLHYSIRILSGGKGNPTGLPGVGPQTIQFFFRDWIDLNWWKYMFKNDEHNQAVWKIFFEEIGQEIDKDVAHSLQMYLVDKDFDDAVLARLNRMAYRLRSGFGSGLGDDAIRQKIRHIISSESSKTPFKY